MLEEHEKCWRRGIFLAYLQNTLLLQNTSGICGYVATETHD